MDDKTNKKSGVITIDLNNLNIENLLNVSHTINMQIKKCIKKQLDDYSDFEKSLVKIPYVENIINKNKDLEDKMETEKKHNEVMAKELEILRNVLNTVKNKDNIELEICEKNDTDKFWLDGTSDDNTEEEISEEDVKQIKLECNKIKRIDDVEFVGNGTENDPIVIDNEEAEEEENDVESDEEEEEPDVELQTFTMPSESNIIEVETKNSESSKEINEVENNSKVTAEKEEDETEEAESEAEEETEEEEEEEEAEEEEAESEEEDELEVSVLEIDGKEYYVSDEVNGEIFSIIKQDDEEDIGDKIGFFKNGVAFFS